MNIPALFKRLAYSVKRIVIVLILASSFYLPASVVIIPAFAQSQPIQQANPYINTNTNPDVPYNLNTWTQNVMINLMAAMTCQLTGINPVDKNQQCLGVDTTTGKIGFVPKAQPESGQIGGAIGIMGNWIGATFSHPPASGIGYLAYEMNKFGIAQPAYAQGAGTGFNGLSPLLPIWQAFRNITYLAFVLVFVVIGLMIMLRVKIDPRTVMTIQNSIPKIIIGLILVTFSFAIAGFLIDLMYVFIFLIFSLFQNIINSFPAKSYEQNQLIEALGQMQKYYQSDSVISVFLNTLKFNDTVGGAADAVKKSLITALCPPPTCDPNSNAGASIIGGMLSGGAAAGAAGALGWLAPIAAAFGSTVAAPILVPTIVGIAVAGLLVGILQATIGGAGLGVFAEFIGGGAAIIAYLFIAIAVIWVLFRLLMQLIQAYMWILIDVIFAPVWILAGMLPGSPISFSAWLRDILAHLSAFPAVIFMFLLAKAFILSVGDASSTGQAFSAPLIGAQSIPAVKGFIGLGMLLLTPQIVNMTKDAFKSPVFKYGTAVGQAIGVGTGAPGGLKNTAMGGLQTYYYLPTGMKESISRIFKGGKATGPTGQ